MVERVMANEPAQQAKPGLLARLPMGPRLIAFGGGLFVLTRVIKFLPLDWVDGPILGLLWLAIIASVGAGAGIWYLQSKRA